jgi:hypothetical protein
MILNIFTLVHVILSLIGISAGLVVMLGFLSEKPLGGVNTLFLWTTILTSMTGYFFPFHGFKPSYVVGAISLLFLALAVLAFRVGHLAGAWGKTYAISAMIALYLNVFVLIAQLFMKVPALKTLAPTGTEPAFKFTQLTALVVFFILTILSAVRFRTAQASTA